MLSVMAKPNKPGPLPVIARTVKRIRTTAEAVWARCDEAQPGRKKVQVRIFCQRTCVADLVIHICDDTNGDQVNRAFETDATIPGAVKALESSPTRVQLCSTEQVEEIQLPHSE